MRSEAKRGCTCGEASGKTGAVTEDEPAAAADQIVRAVSIPYPTQPLSDCLSAKPKQIRRRNQTSCRPRSSASDQAKPEDLEEDVSLEKFPGFLGLTSRGVVAIHADWPAYPLEHGWQIAVITLGSFPFGTQFKRIDDIDKCALLLAQGYGDYENPYDERAFHVAIWHEDLLEAHRLGLVIGVEPLTRRQYEERHREDLRNEMRQAFAREAIPPPSNDILSHMGVQIDGQFVPVSLPSLDEYEGDEDEDFPDKSWLGIAASSVVNLTDQGWARLDGLWADMLEIPELARPRVETLIEHGFYDTALRELGVLLEFRIREITSSESYGLKLVDVLLDQLDSSGRYHNAGLKILRSELRPAFKFVRNEFAHNVVELPRSRAYALLGRMCHVLADVDSVATP
jgi:hypothetical protein